MSLTEKEKKTQEKTMNIIRKYGGYVYKNAQSIYTEKGRPDLTACIPAKLSTLINIFGKDAKIGLFVGIEMKRHGLQDDTSTAQEVVGRQIKKAKGLWFVVDDETFAEALMIKFTEGDIK